MAELKWSISLESAEHIRDMATGLKEYRDMLNDANETLARTMSSNSYLGPRYDLIQEWIEKTKGISDTIDEDIEEIVGDLNRYADKIVEKIKSMG